MIPELSSDSAPDKVSVPILHEKKMESERIPKVPFKKSSLTPEVQKLFNLPDTAQDGENLYSMANWAPIYLPLLDQIRPQKLVEIGSEYGGNTRHLGQYSIAHGIHLHIVDTHPTEDPELAKSSFVHYHRGRSLDFLRNFEGADVYFIDGDHNYQTLLQELDLISDLYTGSGPLAAFVHDTGWPYGIIDSFYDPSTIEGEMPVVSEALGPLPWKSTLDKFGFGQDSQSHSLKVGGEKNGLRAAVQDFIGARKGWQAAYSSPFFGMCFLWKDDTFSETLSDYMKELVAVLSRVEPILAILEWNRILLYIQTQFMGAEWRRQQDIIQSLYDENLHAGKVWKEQQVWIAHLEGKLRGAGIRV
jgi:hypothetical protein